jgi:NAD(P)-dependent dehydrogenase (short-subunit alcohol dehydrogenase family)
MTKDAAPTPTTSIVTGASSGIGQATAIRLAERGDKVLLTYSSRPEGAEQTVATIEADGGEAVALALDLGQSDTFAAFAQQVGELIADRWGRTTFDHLVNNAGFSGMAMFEDTTEQLFDDLVRVDLKGTYFLTQHLLPLLADGGAIVSTTSGASRPSGMTPGFSAYGIAKGGVSTMTKALARELGARGIRVNAVSPGATRTRLGGNAFEHMPEVIPPLIENTLLGRLGEPDDIAKVIAALCSDELAWITGEDIEVSGGFGL